MIGRSKQKQNQAVDASRDAYMNLGQTSIMFRRRSQNNTPVIPAPGNYEDIGIVGKGDDHSTVLNIVGQHYSAPNEPILKTQEYAVNLNYANI